jgi:translation initiation factor IF-3
VRVIDAEGQQLGVLDIKKALGLALDEGLDLVEVSPNAEPPVCRLMDFGKFKYQQSKKNQKKKTQHVVHTKEIKYRPFTGEHDLEVKMRHIQEFLDKGNKVKITMVFRGREVRFKEQGENMLTKIAEELSEVAVIERDAKMEGRNLIMMVAPKKQF